MRRERQTPRYAARQVRSSSESGVVTLVTPSYTASMIDYMQFCTVARGAEVLGELWTPLVVRELLCGSHRFNDIHRGVPRMSQTLLAKRLRKLEDLGVVER